MQLTSPWITWKYNMGRGFVVIPFICLLVFRDMSNNNVNYMN